MLLSLAGAPVPAKMQGRPFLGPATGAPKPYVFGTRDRCDLTAMRIRTVRDPQYRYIRTFTPEVPFFALNEYKENAYPAWKLMPELHRQGKLTPEQALLCAPRQPEEQLYDMAGDPHEVRNLAGSPQPEHAAALKRLRTELENWMVRTDDQGRIPESISPEEADAASRAVREKAKKKR